MGTVMAIGRRSIFSGKDRSHPRTVMMTKTGHLQLEAARKRLARLVGWNVHTVSVADTFEFLARGHEATVAYLQQTGQITGLQRDTKGQFLANTHCHEIGGGS